MITTSDVETMLYTEMIHCQILNNKGAKIATYSPTKTNYIARNMQTDDDVLGITFSDDPSNHDEKIDMSDFFR